MLEAVAAVDLAIPDLRRFVHGTTRVTNAIVEGRLPPIALVATAGFEDVLAFGRYRRAELYRLDLPRSRRRWCHPNAASACTNA